MTAALGLPTLHRQRGQKVINAREKTPEKLDLRAEAKRESAGQAPVPTHETRRPAFQWWRGFRTSTHLRATDPTKLMVRALPYAAAWAVALLNLGLGAPGPEKRPNFRATQRVRTCRTSMTAQSTKLEALDT